MTKKQNIVIYELCDELIEVKKQLKQIRDLFSLNQVKNLKKFFLNGY